MKKILSSANVSLQTTCEMEKMEERLELLMLTMPTVATLTSPCDDNCPSDGVGLAAGCDWVTCDDARNSITENLTTNCDGYFTIECDDFFIDK